MALTELESLKLEKLKREKGKRTPKEKPGILSSIGGALKTGLKAGVEDVRTEGLGPLAKTASSVAFGLPRAAVKKFAPQAEEETHCQAEEESEVDHESLILVGP